MLGNQFTKYRQVKIDSCLPQEIRNKPPSPVTFCPPPQYRSIGRRCMRRVVMRREQNGTFWNTEKRCLLLDGPGRVLARPFGGFGKGAALCWSPGFSRLKPGLQLRGRVKSRPNSLVALYSSVQKRDTLPKGLSENDLRSKNQLCLELKCPKMSQFVPLTKRCYWADRVGLSPFAPRKCGLALRGA